MAMAIEFAFWPKDQLALAVVLVSAQSVSFEAGSSSPIDLTFHASPESAELRVPKSGRLEHAVLAESAPPGAGRRFGLA